MKFRDVRWERRESSASGNIVPSRPFLGTTAEHLLQNCDRI